MSDSQLLAALSSPLVSTGLLAVSPLMAALASALVCFAFLNFPRAQFFASVVCGVLQLFLSVWLVTLTASGEVLVTQASGWRAPFGITFVVDLLSALMSAVSAFLGLATIIYARAFIRGGRLQRMFHVVFHFLLMGVMGCYATGDLFNLYVWFEVLLLSSFVLMSFGRESERLRGAFQYVTLNLIGSGIFLLGLGFLYNATGTLNFAQLMQLRGDPALNTTTIALVSFCLLIAFGMKAAMFPLYGWLPASYPSMPAAPLAFFGGVLTKIGVYTLLRFFATPSALSLGWIPTALVAIACLTMLFGVFGAATQSDFRRILSFHIVSQIGYMVLGVALGTAVGVGAAIFYLMHHMVVKSALFMVSGVFERLYGTSDLKSLGSGASRHPWLAVLFAIPALSLAGLPPLSGFWAKLSTLYAAAHQGWYISFGVALFTGLLTLYSMSKVWNEAFLKESSTPPVPVSRATRVALYLPLVMLSAWTVYLGVSPTKMVELSDRAAASVVYPQIVIQKVLGGSQ